MRLIPAFLALAMLAAPALGDGTLATAIRPADAQRLKLFAHVKAQALAEARAKGEAKDVALLNEALSGAPLPVEGSFDATGTWRCRTIKAGGLLPLVIYPWFSCRISDDGAGWHLEKLTGSQRTAGRFYTESATRMIFLGAGYVAGEPVPRYGAGPKTDQVAVAERLKPNGLVLMFPEPYYESKLDLLVLER